MSAVVRINSVGVIQQPVERAFPTGWLLLLALVLATPLFHAFLLTNSPGGRSAARALLVGSAAIGVRAIVGIYQRRRSRVWVAYCCLYPGLILITAVLALLFGR